jgi:uncharacterized membrane protein
LLEDVKGLPLDDKRISMQDKKRIPVFEKAMKDAQANRIATQSPKQRQIGAAHQMIAAGFVVRRNREAAQRLAETLELYYATRSSIRNLLHHRDAPPKDRKRAPLSDGEQKIIRYVYREPLDAPLPSLRKNRASIRAFIGHRNG